MAMRVIIAGSRSYAPCCAAWHVSRAMGEARLSGPPGTPGAPRVPGDGWREVTVVLCGQARGIDNAGEDWACCNWVPIEYYPADWAKHGKKAGALRNAEMAKRADALVAVWDGASPGTSNMIKTMRRLRKEVHVLRAVDERCPTCERFAADARADLWRDAPGDES